MGEPHPSFTAARSYACSHPLYMLVGEEDPAAASCNPYRSIKEGLVTMLQREAGGERGGGGSHEQGDGYFTTLGCNQRAALWLQPTITLSLPSHYIFVHYPLTQPLMPAARARARQSRFRLPCRVRCASSTG